MTSSPCRSSLKDKTRPGRTGGRRRSTCPPTRTPERTGRDRAERHFLSIEDAGERARRVIAAILADLGRAERGVVVDSPPGAGKSTLVVAAAASLAERGERVMVVGQTNEQVDDLVDRLASEHGVLRIGRLSAQGYVPTERVVRHPNITASTTIADLIDYPLVIAPAAKWAMLTSTGLTSTGLTSTGITDSGVRWPWAIVDEAYQMRSDALLRIAHLFGHGLVGR